MATGHLKKEYVKKMEEQFKLEREAVELLDIVVAEWNHDPMSVQCFDLRIVNRATQVIERLKELGR